MDALLTAIASKISGSALASDVGGRIWLDEYQDDPPVVYPYVVYFIVSSVPADTFKDKLEDIIIQFSIFSASKSGVEITGIYNNLIALFDDCELTVTGYAIAWMQRQNLTTIAEEITTDQGSSTVKHWAVDYRLILEKS